MKSLETAGVEINFLFLKVFLHGAGDFADHLDK
jgi:hypothetical protein